MKPSSCWSTVVILGVGKGVCTKRVFTSLKSPKNLTVSSALGIINAGDQHSEIGYGLSTPNRTNLFTSFLKAFI